MNLKCLTTRVEMSRVESNLSEFDLIRICLARVQHELFFLLKFNLFKIHKKFSSLGSIWFHFTKLKLYSVQTHERINST